MDGNGFTGFDPVVAKNNIDEFWHAAVAAHEHLWATFEDLWVDLEFTWCSEKAVEFDKKYNNRGTGFQRVVLEFFRACDNIAKNARKAYSIIAKANSYSDVMFLEEYEINEEDHPTEYGSGFYYEFGCNLHPAHPTNGVVGMNIMQVKLAVDVFKTKIQGVISEIDNLPMNIAFYDEDGSQAAAYASEIKKMKDKIIEMTNQIVTEIASAMENEQNSILLAKQQATESLNG